jgi:hypothetical protein
MAHQATDVATAEGGRRGRAAFKVERKLDGVLAG